MAVRDDTVAPAGTGLPFWLVILAAVLLGFLFTLIVAVVVTRRMRAKKMRAEHAVAAYSKQAQARAEAAARNGRQAAAEVIQARVRVRRGRRSRRIAESAVASMTFPQLSANPNVTPAPSKKARRVPVDHWVANYPLP